MLRAFLFIFTVGTCSVCAHWPSDPSGMSSLRQQATPLLASYAFFDHCCVYTIFFHHMSGESTSPAPRLCISKDEVYQALLDACIEGIVNFPVEKRQRRISGKCTSLQFRPSTCLPSQQPSTHSTTTTSPIDTSNSTGDDCPISPPLQHSPTTTLISPPPTPKHVDTASLTRSPAPDAAMNRAPLHGAPVRGQAPPSRGPSCDGPPSYGAQPAYGNQDARGNLAVQPATTTGSFKLKKAAVKMVKAAAPTPGPVQGKPKEVER
jgi:hypothetical protein